MGFGRAWSVRMDEDGAEFIGADREYLEWALGQANMDLANSYASGMPVIRRAARRVREKILIAIEEQGA